MSGMKAGLGKGSAPGGRLGGLDPVTPGDYFHSERDLYRVEQRDGGRALVEDCRTGVLIDIEVARLLELRRLER